MSTTPTPLHLPVDPHHHSEPGELANKLGYAGLIPFVGGALFVWLLVGRVEDEPFVFVVRALTSYAALIVSFLGGIRWGTAIGP